MRYNVITYLLGEGIRNVFKNKKSTSASIIIMSLTMLIFGVFFVITQNINSIMKQIESEQGIEVFLYDISEDQTKALEDYIRNIDGINTVEYKSKEDALNQLKSQFKDREDLLSGYDENNIFPASYVVTLTDLTKNNEVKQKIDEYDKDKPDTEKVIKKITSSDETITTLINLANGIRIITGVILVILIIISIFIISNTIKLTVDARRKEISIMKYVGATNSFIRWPFIVEGIIIGIISGAISIIILGINYNLIANKILEMSRTYQGKNRKKTHIGYYLIEDGKAELLKELGIKNTKIISKEQKSKRYIFSINLVPILLTILFVISFNYISRNAAISIVSGIILYVPISQMFMQVLNYILSKKVKPKLMPKLDFSKGIPEKYSTFIVIPTIINSKDKVKELFEKLEVYYLANKSENIYFALLGDCTSSKNEKESFDEEIIKTGLEEAERLNKKYKTLVEENDKFYFLYRNRVWNAGEKSFLGWERKRGLLCQFNDFIVNGANSFRVNTIANEEKDICNKIKYVITLDSDTNLVLDSAQELIGAMAHILNRPVLAKEKNIVEQGHAIIQPRIGIDLEASRKNLFTKIYAGLRRNRFIYKCCIRYLL